MYVNANNPIQLKIKLAVAASICAMSTVSSAIALLVVQAPVA